MTKRKQGFPFPGGCARIAALLACLILLACAGGAAQSNQQPPAAPVIVTFSAAQNQVPAGASTLLTATFTGGTGVIDHGVGSVSSGVPISSGDLTAATTFLLTVSGDGGTLTQTLTVGITYAPALLITAPGSVIAGQAGYAASAPLKVGASYQWAISGGTINAGNGTAQIYFTAGPAGTLQLSCVTVDATGASSAPGTVSIPIWSGSGTGTGTPAPVIASFSASPATIEAGQFSTLSWSVTGATSLSLSQGIGIVWGSETAVDPGQTASYTLTASNAGGSVSASATVTVLSPAPGGPPVISSFRASPDSMFNGGYCTLLWSVSGATSLTLEDLVSGSIKTVSGSGWTVIVDVVGGSDTWMLTATNSAGSTQAVTSVNVTD